jgi:hypothetical protein
VLSDLSDTPVQGAITLHVKLALGVVNSEDLIRTRRGWVCPDGAPERNEFTCTFAEPELSDSWEGFNFRVSVGANAPEVLITEVEVSGGGSAAATKVLTNPHEGPAEPFSITAFQVASLDPEAEPDTQAGARLASLRTIVKSPAVVGEAPFGQPVYRGVEEARDVLVDLPPGLVGNPQAAEKCSITVFHADVTQCPPGSKLGTFALGGNNEVFPSNNLIYNLDPEPGFPAELGLFVPLLAQGVVLETALVHTSRGYVIRAFASGLLRGLPDGPYYLAVQLAGNPSRANGLGTGRPFFTNPMNCSGAPLESEVRVDTWRNPANVPLMANGNGMRDFEAANFGEPQWHSATSGAPAVSGCSRLKFEPSLQVATEESRTDSPTGLAFKLKVPQNEDPEGLATPPLRNAVVTLPKGLVVNPSSADGLDGCTEAQIAPDSTHPGGCPDASKIGTATLRTPLIDHPLEGSLYLGTPECAPCSNADAKSGKLLRLYIEINDPKTGVVVKLPGTVATDTESGGQLTATFTENPQLPFEELELHVKSGQRAPLTTPLTCGEYTTTSDLMPWSAPQSGPDAKPQSRFNITSGPNGTGCPNGEGGLANSPKFEAGTTVPLAGSYSPFVLKVNRENGSQRIGALEATLPLGLVGRIAGLPYCPDSAIAAAGSKGGREEQANPSCPLASEVGVVNVGAGSGNPFFVQGHAYLAGPYKGAPLSLEIITPAVAGPFDLGTVAVRTALYVNESTAQIHAVSDPIPSILAGIPLDVRSIALNMSRPEFTLNPTSCNAMAVLASTTSTQGQTASLQSRFQVGGCNGLEFKPALKLAFTGQTKRLGNPAVKAVLTQPKGQNANVAGATVILPKGMFIDQAHVSNPCTRVQFNSGGQPGSGCPAKSVLGSAKVWTPLLEKPEEGPVYFRSNGGERELPDLVVALRGQIPLQLVGFIDSVGRKGAEVRRVRSRFLGLPDAPVSRFELRLAGGKKGLLENSKALCKLNRKAKFQLTGQNGKAYDTEPKVQVRCPKPKKHKGGKKAGGKGKKK